MTDIMMKDNRFIMKDGDFVLVNEIDEIKQHLIVAVNTFYGDWIFDLEKGINYSYGLRHPEYLEHQIKSQIMGVQGVKSIENFELVHNRENQTANIFASIKTDYGNIDFTETLQK